MSYLFSNKEIDLLEYTNQSVITPRIHLQQTTTIYTPLTFNGIKLSWAIGRTMASHQLNIPELWVDCISTLISTYNIIASSDDFKLLESRLDRLRDFSKSSRIGEIAQGVAYLFAQEKLKYPIVTDFHYFLAKQGITVPAKETTPDFVCQKKKADKNVILLESKGTEINATTSIKGVLSKGKTQCDNGQLLMKTAGFNVTNKYVACAEFSVDASANKSTIHFVDPENDRQDSLFDDSLFKFHYASWFYLVGDHSNVTKLINGENIDFRRNYYDEISYKNEIYYVANWRHLERILRNNRLKSLFFRGLIFDPFYHYQIKIGISKKIIDHLSGSKILESIPEFTIQSNEEFDDQQINSFIDGTIILASKALK
jgi:hypothetical protein